MHTCDSCEWLASSLRATKNSNSVTRPQKSSGRVPSLSAFAIIRAPQIEFLRANCFCEKATLQSVRTTAAASDSGGGGFGQATHVFLMAPDANWVISLLYPQFALHWPNNDNVLARLVLRGVPRTTLRTSQKHVSGVYLSVCLSVCLAHEFMTLAQVGKELVLHLPPGVPDPAKVPWSLPPFSLSDVSLPDMSRCETHLNKRSNEEGNCIPELSAKKTEI